MAALDQESLTLLSRLMLEAVDGRCPASGGDRSDERRLHRDERALSNCSARTATSPSRRLWKTIPGCCCVGAWPASASPEPIVPRLATRVGTCRPTSWPWSRFAGGTLGAAATDIPDRGGGWWGHGSRRARRRPALGG